jgi:hypothetical protein
MIARVTNHAKGTFDVKMGPQTDEQVGDPTVGRMSIVKPFHAALEATSKGQMLAAGTGELVGLTGRMTINVVDRKHFYAFEYSIGEQ